MTPEFIDMLSSAPTTKSQARRAVVGRIPRTVICGALGFALVFSIGAAPVNAQDAVPPTTTTQPGISPEEPAPADGLTTEPVPPQDDETIDGTETEATAPTLSPEATEPVEDATDGEGTAEPSAEDAPSQAPGEVPEEASPKSKQLAPALPRNSSAPTVSPQLKQTTEAPASEATKQPETTTSAPASDTAKEKPSPTATPNPTPSSSTPPAAVQSSPEPEVEGLQSGGPGAYMGMSMAKEQAAAAAEAPRMARMAPLAARAPGVPAGVPGLDVSGHQADQGNTRSRINWASEWSQGARFSYMKATEGSYMYDKSRTSHTSGARAVGMLTGAYHFAIPDYSSATAQADFFLAHGGRWTGDGKTLPPLLDIENNPYGASCYGLSPSAMVNWIKTFSNRVLSRTGRLPMIYTNYYWWQECTGNSTAFTKQPLHIAAYGASSPWKPGGWPVYSMWQFSSTGPYGMTPLMPNSGDSNVWNGTLTSLKTFARESGQRPAVSRVNGKDRYEVSAAVSRSTFPVGIQTAYVASGGIYTDALSGSAPAGHIGGPVLLTATNVLPDVIRAELRRLKPKQIVVLGGAASVSNSVMTLLRDYAPSVVRMNGKDRYEVSAAVSRSTYWVGTQIVYIASGAIYTDALSGSAAAAHNGSPVLLTAPTVLPNVIRAELKRLKPQKIIILGGSATVSNGVMSLLRNYAPSVTRMDGKNRYEVSANVSRATFSPGVRTAYIASGGIYTDALSGSAAAGYVDGPVLLTSPTVLPDVIRDELRRLKPQRIVVLGGPSTVSNAVMKKLQTYKP